MGEILAGTDGNRREDSGETLHSLGLFEVVVGKQIDLWHEKPRSVLGRAAYFRICSLLDFGECSS